MNDKTDHKAVNQKLFEGLFKRKLTADYWGMCARNLWQAAEVLFSAYESSTAENGEPIHPENTELNIPATLLYGYSMENAIKGLLIKKHNLDVTNLSNYKRENEWMHHELVALFNDTGISASKKDKLILKTLTQHILWAGKYPVSKNFERFILPNQYEHDSLPPVKNFPPSSVNISMRHELKKLFNMLLGELQSECRQST